MKSFALLINAANGILTDSISNFEIEYITQNKVDIQNGDVIIGCLGHPINQIRMLFYASKSSEEKKNYFKKILDTSEGVAISLLPDLQSSLNMAEAARNDIVEINNETSEKATELLLEKLNSLKGSTSSPSPASAGKNVILYGVPGCGKSHYIAEHYCNDDAYMERVVFHPDYSYSDFIGQILPDNSTGHIEYLFTPGPFTRILEKAVSDPSSQYYLIIEEINRGNAPAIFGDIFQLLDRKNGESEYGITNHDIARYVFKNDSVKIKIPSNLTILSTMNTADQNVFTLDTAFKRRWEMKSIPNKIEECDNRDTLIANSKVTWFSFVNTINNKIVEMSKEQIGSEDKRLGAYFVNAKELQDTNLFAEKVLLYLWNDAFKYNRNVFKSNIDTLEELIEKFKVNGLEDIFDDSVTFAHYCDDDYVVNPEPDNSLAKYETVSNNIKNWLENKKTEDEKITYIKEGGGISYKRFSTTTLDQYFPLADQPCGDWNDKHQVLYEIEIFKEGSIRVVLTCSTNEGTTDEMRERYRKGILPFLKKSGLTKWNHRAILGKRINPDMSSAEINSLMEEAYVKITEFDEQLSQKFV